MRAFEALQDVVRALRAPDGCAWDRAQTTRSLARHLLQEAYEVVDAVDSGDDGETCAELGDLLFVTLLLCATAEERGAFDVDDALDRARKKLVRRHPHVFAGAAEAPSWSELKRAEGRGSALD
ncbi:MAG TPA: MazG nucleotide pyrophosphohydrolase domain-containing protein, partial [Myxococcota bacterium]|nr:MazG nucleotide pyrophosphohydrolase domain-containing protein [Myxococcota bacterium]